LALQVFGSFKLQIKFGTLEKMQNEPLNQTDYNAPLERDLAELPPEAPPSPDNPPWNSLVGVGVWLMSVFAIVLFPVFFIVPYMLVNRQLSAEAIQTDNTAILLNLIAVLPAHLFTLAIAWFVATRNGRFSLGETLGLGSGGFQWWHYIAILVTFFALAGAVNYFIPEGDNQLLQILRSSRAATYIIALLATFTAPLVEEVVYRGILYSALQRSIGVGGAIALVTFFFALVHVPQYWGSPGTIFLICLLSLILTLIRWRTGSLLPCIIMHTIFNGLQSLFLIGEPYLPKMDSAVQEQAGLIIKLFT
jgi:membrane protease YdiL (CAAX protease family)